MVMNLDCKEMNVEKSTNIVVVDLEATCRGRGQHKPIEMETIEIDAVMVSGPDCRVQSEFNRFVKPIKHPGLSEFCK